MSSRWLTTTYTVTYGEDYCQWEHKLQSPSFCLYQLYKHCSPSGLSFVLQESTSLSLIFLGNFSSLIRVSLSTTCCIYCSESQNANQLSREAAVLLLSKIISFHSETQEWPFTFLEGQRKNLEDMNTNVYSPERQILSLKPITLGR